MVSKPLSLLSQSEVSNTVIMADPAEELEPLFDYRRVQPTGITPLDDDDSPRALSPPSSKERMKTSYPVVEVGDGDVQVVEIRNSENKDEEEEEDWLPPPPKALGDFNKLLDEDSTIKELRLKKQELQKLANSARDIMQSVEESVSRDLSSSGQDALGTVADQLSKPPPERAKIVISFQGKDGHKQIRVYKDEKFERLFKMYADNVKLDIQSLAFSFDGDKVNPAASPGDLGMEDDDIIAVHVKKRC